MKWLRRFCRWLAPKSVYEIIAGILLAVFISVPAYYLIVDQHPIVRNDSEILTPIVRQGEDFQIAYDVEWSSNCQVTGFRFIVDGAGYRHERIVDTRYVSAGEDKFTISIAVPLAAAPGPAEYRGEVEYVCGPWQRLFPLRRTLTARQFEIIPGEPAAGGITFACPSDRPIRVQSHCRREPSYTLVVD